MDVSKDWRRWQKEDPEIYRATDLFMEAVDWIVHWLTGNLKRLVRHSRVKCILIKGRGYPGQELFKGPDPMTEDFI